MLWIRDIVVRIREAQKHTDPYPQYVLRTKLKRKANSKSSIAGSAIRYGIWICVGSGVNQKHKQGTSTVFARYVTIRILPLVLYCVCLLQGELDNGRGRARLNMFRHLHEIQSGRWETQFARSKTFSTIIRTGIRSNPTHS